MEYTIMHKLSMLYGFTSVAGPEGSIHSRKYNWGFDIFSPNSSHILLLGHLRTTKFAKPAFASEI